MTKPCPQPRRTARRPHGRPARLSLALLGTVALLNPASAGFQNTPSSVKAEALGGAFMGISGDPNCVFLNPAGLADLESAELSLMYGKPLAGVQGLDLAQGYAALGLPLSEKASLGLGNTLFRAAGLLSEYQATAGLGAFLSPKVAAGIGASYLYHRYEIGGDPAYSGQPAFSNGLSKGAVGLHLGVLALVSPRLQLGLSARNLNTPDVGLKERDPVPRELRIGTLYRSRFASLLLELEQRDDGLGSSASRKNAPKAGVEVPLKGAALRLGVNRNAVTAGVGLRLGAFALDYAFGLITRLETSNYGNQSVAVSYRLGGPRSSRREGRAPDEAKAAGQAAWKGLNWHRW
ncbi:MAG: hypothetical protein HY554_06475 [Elusimicrobia bacterium]|nr:hypothetical protein [Elusimicrobiota bacterium]